MRVDVEEPLFNVFTNEPFNFSGKNATLRMALVAALLGNYGDLESVDYAEKCYRFKLAQRINNPDVDEIDLSQQDISLVKRLIGMHYIPVVVGAIDSILTSGEFTLVTNNEKSPT